MVSCHPGNIQILQCDQIVVDDQMVSQFIEKILTTVG
jgi:hypothetical protein